MGLTQNRTLPNVRGPEKPQTQARPRADCGGNAAVCSPDAADHCQTHRLTRYVTVRGKVLLSSMPLTFSISTARMYRSIPWSLVRKRSVAYCGEHREDASVTPSTFQKKANGSFQNLKRCNSGGMVCKRKNSVYAFARSKLWLKVKTASGRAQNAKADRDLGQVVAEPLKRNFVCQINP